MKLLLFAYFRDITGKTEMEWTRPAATMGELLADMTRRYGPAFAKWVYEDGDKLSHMSILLVNGRDIRDGQGLDTPLKPDDTIALFPPLAGG